MNDIITDELINSFRKRPKRTQPKEVQTDENMAALDILESDLNKVRIENLKLQKQLKQAQDNLALYGNNYTNTSSKFMLPSEFKNKYESMVKESLAAAFVTLFDRPKLLAQTVQTSCLFLESYIRHQLTQKTQQIAQVIGIPPIGLQSALLKIYQDNYTSILSYDETVLLKLKEHLKLSIMSDWVEEDNEDLDSWIRQYWTLLSYILLSDQDINIGFSKVTYEIVQFKKNEYYCVDGFGKDGVKSLAILPPIMRKNQPFNGLKYTVLILPSDFDCAIFEEDLKIEDLAQELKSYNSPKQITAPKPLQEIQESRPFFSQQSSAKECKEECRIKQQTKVPRKSLLEEMKVTLQLFNQLNTSEQSHRDRECGRIVRQATNPMKDDIRKSIQQTLKQTRIGSNWQKQLQNKHNKENSLNQSQNCSYNIQQFIKRMQVDNNNVKLKKSVNESKIMKSFCQSQQITDRLRNRAQSNDGKCVVKLDDLSMSPLRRGRN